MSVVIDELRAALARHDEWPTKQTSAAVIDAARRLVGGVDMRAEVIEQMRRRVTPSEQAIAELLGSERGE
jgi:glutaredoxin-related protein